MLSSEFIWFSLVIISASSFFKTKKKQRDKSFIPISSNAYIIPHVEILYCQDDGLGGIFGPGSRKLFFQSALKLFFSCTQAHPLGNWNWIRASLWAWELWCLHKLPHRGWSCSSTKGTYKIEGRFISIQHYDIKLGFLPFFDLNFFK